MAKRFFYVSAGLFLLALAYHMGAGSAGAQSGERALIGHYAVIPGGPSDFGGAILLDSVTGKTWGWQPLEMTDKSGATTQSIHYWGEMGPRGTVEAIKIMQDLEAKGIRPSR